MGDSNNISGDNCRIGAILRRSEKHNNKLTPAESGSFGDHKPEMRSINELPGSSENLELHSELPDIGKWFSSYGYESPELNSDDDGFHYSVFTAPENEQDEDTEKHKEFSSTNGDETTLQSCPVNVEPEEGTNTAISSIMLGCEVDDSLEPICKIKAQKLIEEDTDSDGFVPIKRRREEENCVIKLKSGLNQETKPMKKGKKEETIIRNPLAEMTNHDHLEFAGKWQCPRKNKQVLGPILKQRRLDRWVHRL